jgi:hypothetical protein
MAIKYLENRFAPGYLFDHPCQRIGHRSGEKGDRIFCTDRIFNWCDWGEIYLLRLLIQARKDWGDQLAQLELHTSNYAVTRPYHRETKGRAFNMPH